jgi:hypothetical protein
MLKRLFLLAGVALALATIASASLPDPPCDPCIIGAQLAH